MATGVLLFRPASRAGSLAAVLAVALAGCAGGGGTSALPGRAGGTSPASTTRTTLTITVPKATATSASQRKPRYISPATQSVTLAVRDHTTGATVLNETAGLTPTAQGCTSTLASTVCTLILPLAPGTYDAAVATYDGFNATTGAASGNELSMGQLVAFTVQPAATNVVSLTLSGIPAALSVVSASVGLHGSLGTGFTLYGLGAQQLVIEALDADQNIIVGAGAPSYQIAPLSGSGFGITNPTTTSPNRFSLAPPGTQGTAETFSVTASYPDGTCSLSGTVCNASFSVKNHLQTLFVANFVPYGGSVTAYAAPYANTTPLTVTNGVSGADDLALDGAGDLFVANQSAGTVTEYAPPYTSAPSTTINTGGSSSLPAALAFDAAGNLFVGVSSGTGPVTEYAPPYTGAGAVIDSPGAIDGLVFDSVGDLFVSASPSNYTVSKLTPPFGGGSTPITSTLSSPQVLAVDGAADLFVAPVLGNSVSEFAPPYTSASTVITSGVNGPDALVVDASGNLFIANHASSSVTVYAPPYTNPPIATITSGVNGPRALALDGADDLFVANAGTVTEYAPPYTGLTATISNGVSTPLALRVSP